eukprot:5052291-Pleurochrysis_carterae.AAC.1
MRADEEGKQARESRGVEGHKRCVMASIRARPEAKYTERAATNPALNRSGSAGADHATRRRTGCFARSQNQPHAPGPDDHGSH